MTLPVEPTIPTGTPEFLAPAKALADILAASEQFQAWTGAVDEVEAAEHIYLHATDTVARPAAIVRLVRTGTTPLALGTRLMHGTLYVQFEAPVAEGAADYGAEVEAHVGAVNAVIGDVMAAADAGGSIHLRSVALVRDNEHEAALARSPEQEAGTPYWVSLWAMEYGLS